jgi:hypothetical protein
MKYGYLLGIAESLPGALEALLMVTGDLGSSRPFPRKTNTCWLRAVFGGLAGFI